MFKKIIIPLDGSVLAENAVHYAQELALHFDSTLYLVQVLTPIYPVMTGDMMMSSAELMQTIHEQSQQDAETYLKAKSAELNAHGLNTQPMVIDGGEIADALLELAEKIEADTIVMSTHGRTGFGRWVFGSVAERVVRHANIPVLMVRVQGSAPN